MRCCKVVVLQEKFINHFGIEETIYRTLIKKTISEKEYSSKLTFCIET